MTNPHTDSFCRRTRREMLWEAGAGFTGLAMAGLFGRDGFFGGSAHAADVHKEGSAFTNPLAPKLPPLPAKAKSVIFLFMYGGPSQVDTFDYKPDLYALDGKTIPIKTFGRGGKKNEGRVVGPKWKFKQYGQSGKYVSDLFPNLAKNVDDIAFIHSLTADSPIHGSAMLQMNSGKILSGSPSLGSWVNYGLGSVNENLPGFVVMLDPTGGPISGSKNWSSGYMPATYQGTVLRSAGAPVLDLKRPEGRSEAQQRRDARRAARLQRRPPCPPRGQLQPCRANRQLQRWPSPCSGTRPRRSGSTVNRSRRRRCTGSTRTRPRTSAAAASWPGALLSVEFGSSSFTLAVPTTTATGTRTATCSTTTTTTRVGPTSRSPAS